MKYSYVPQTEAPYKLDRTSPDVDWTICEPEKVRYNQKMLSVAKTTQQSAMPVCLLEVYTDTWKTTACSFLGV